MTSPAQSVAQEALDLAAEIREALGCERVTLFFRHEDGRFVSAVAEGLEGMDLDVKPGEGLAGKALEAGQSLASDEPLYDPRTLSRIRDHYTGFTTQSLLARPVLNVRKRPVAVVQLVNAPSGRFETSHRDRLAAYDRTLRRLARRMPGQVRNVWTASAAGAPSP